MKKILKKVGLIFVSLVIILIAIFIMGPKLRQPVFSNELPPIDIELSELNKYVESKEVVSGEIKTDNEARLIWHDSSMEMTEYALVYLHGFGASYREGYPVNMALADSLNANQYLARLAGHGLVKEDAFVGLTAEAYMASAFEAVSIGKKLGRKLILVGTSTGASQALYIASQFPDVVEALVLYSPYIELANVGTQGLVRGPWAGQIMEFVFTKDVTYTERPDSVAAYWSTFYHYDAYYSLFSMIKATMNTQTYQKVSCPVFLGYYYKDEEHQDDVVSVKAMHKMFESLGTENKKQIAFPEAGDHVIASSLRSHSWRAVQDSSWAFLEQNLLLN
ncbi:alpha/beta hydrolase [Marivirga lumbricoides]|uniref:Alpha/beta hydrolase n=1 Tax=Marivirga lumbricoides TaxID=1046115 RepID=A0A2T4DVB6_9BACT|nr:alpha/beta hydrolase [Marivirga lumbricoides]